MLLLLPLFQPLLLLIVFLLELLQLLLLLLLELLSSLVELLLLSLIGLLLLSPRIILIERLPLLSLLLLSLIGLLLPPRIILFERPPLLGLLLLFLIGLLLPPRIVLLELLALLDLLLFDLLTLLVLLVPQILKFLLVLLLELRIAIVAAGPRRWRTVVKSPGVCRGVPGSAALIRLACNVRRRRSIGIVRPGGRRILCRPRAIWVPLLHICPVRWGVLCRTLSDRGRHLNVWTSRLNVLRLCPSHL